MNRRTITKILTKKHNEFVASIEDVAVRELVDRNSIITGGSIVSLLLGEKINDFDYYFTDKETCIAVARYYVKKFNQAHPDNTYLTTTNLSKPVVEVGETRVKIVVPSVGIVSDKDTQGYQYFEGLPDEVGQDYVEKITEADDVDGSPIEKIEQD